MNKKLLSLIWTPFLLTSCFPWSGPKYEWKSYSLQYALFPKLQDYFTDVNYNTIENYFKNDYIEKNRDIQDKWYNGILTNFTKDAFELEKVDGTKKLDYDYDQKLMEVRKLDGAWINQNGEIADNLTIKYHVILRHLIPDDNINNIKFTQASYLLLSDQSVHSFYETKTYDDFKLTGDYVIDGGTSHGPDVAKEEIEISRLYRSYISRADLIKSNDYKRKFSPISNEKYSNEYASFINGLGLAETKEYVKNIYNECKEDHLLVFADHKNSYTEEAFRNMREIKYNTECLDNLSKKEDSTFNLMIQKDWYYKWKYSTVFHRRQDFIYPIIESKTTDWTIGRTYLSFVWDEKLILDSNEQAMVDYIHWHESDHTWTIERWKE